MVKQRLYAPCQCVLRNWALHFRATFVTRGRPVELTASRSSTAAARPFLLLSAPRLLSGRAAQRALELRSLHDAGTSVPTQKCSSV